MSYFQIQHKKHGQQWKYDFWKVTGNDRIHLKTKFLPQELTTEEVTVLQGELKRLYSDALNVKVETKAQPYNKEAAVDSN